MKVVMNTTTKRLVYREDPDFQKGYGILNAILLGLGTKHTLTEIDVTDTEWKNELDLQQQERPPTTQQQIDALTTRVTALEQTITPI